MVEPDPTWATVVKYMSFGMLVGALAGFALGMSLATDLWRSRTVQHGAAEYDKEGVWRWRQ